MPKYRYTDPETKRTWVSDSKLTADELDEAFGDQTPPLSALGGKDPMQEIATHGVNTALLGGALRTGLPIAAGVATGIATENPLIGRAVQGATSMVGTYLANKLEGKETTGRELATEGVLGAVVPGEGSTVARGALKNAAFGFGSVTLGALAKGEPLPPVGTMALNTIIGGAVGGGVTKLHLHSALKEVLPEDVANETHSVLTQGKITETGIANKEDLNQIKITLGNVKKVKGKFAPKASTTTFQSGAPEEPVDIQFGSPKFGPKYQDPKGLTALFYKATPPPRLFDRLQKQTGVPVYDEVYRPVHDNIHDYEALDKEVKKIHDKFLNNPDVPEPVKNIIGSYTRNALHVNDKTYQHLVFAWDQIKKHIPYLKEVDSHDLANMIIGAPQLSLLGGRIGTPARVLSHIFQTGYMQLGERGLAKGIKGALSRGGWLDATADGVLEKIAAPEEISQTGGRLGKVMQASYYGIGKAADLSRVVVHQGQKYLTARAIQKAGGDVEKFVSLAKLRVGLPEAEMGEVVKLYQQGNMEGAIKASAIARANSSVPLHSRAERAMGTTGGVGSRLAGGLSTWPLFYGNLLKDTFISGGGTKTEKALAFSRWYAANYILANAIARPIYKNIVGESPEKAQQRAEGFTYFAPLFYTLGPAVDIYKGTVEGGKELVTGRNKYGNPVSTGTALLHVSKALKPAIPFSYAATDIASGISTMLRKTTEDRQ